eukprot:scaffold71216_cov42-Attheya_sp.AAC.2
MTSPKVSIHFVTSAASYCPLMLFALPYNSYRYSNVAFSQCTQQSLGLVPCSALNMRRLSRLIAYSVLTN